VCGTKQQMMVVFRGQTIRVVLYISDLDRLKQAAADPSKLSQKEILKAAGSAERDRLSRVRNIGIAVRT
jgi:hypothetical protein